MNLFRVEPPPVSLVLSPHQQRVWIKRHRLALAAIWCSVLGLSFNVAAIVIVLQGPAPQSVRWLALIGVALLVLGARLMHAEEKLRVPR